MKYGIFKSLLPRLAILAAEEKFERLPDLERLTHKQQKAQHARLPLPQSLEQAGNSINVIYFVFDFSHVPYSACPEYTPIDVGFLFAGMPQQMSRQIVR